MDSQKVSIEKTAQPQTPVRFAPDEQHEFVYWLRRRKNLPLTKVTG